MPRVEHPPPTEGGKMIAKQLHELINNSVEEKKFEVVINFFSNEISELKRKINEISEKK